MQEIYWDTLTEPHPNAQKNLDKLVRTMIAEGFVNLNKLTSANKLSRLAGVHYPQMSNLLNRPGFVKVYRKGQVVGWYWDPSLGAVYPPQFSATSKLVRAVQLDNDYKGINETNQTVNTEVKPYSWSDVAEANKTLRTQLRAQDLLKPNERILTLEGKYNKGKTNKNELTTLFLDMMTSITKSESPPERYAAAMYEIAENINNGTLVVTDLPVDQ